MAMIHSLGDGSLKADYLRELKVKHAEESVQIEKDDQLALELLEEEEAQLRTTQERRETMLLEDRRIATDLAQRLKSEARPEASSHVHRQVQVVKGSNRDGKQKNKRGSRQKMEGHMAPQKNRIMHYFNINGKNGGSGDSSGIASHSSGSSSSSSRDSSSSRRRSTEDGINGHEFSDSGRDCFSENGNHDMSQTSTHSGDCVEEVALPTGPPAKRCPLVSDTSSPHSSRTTLHGSSSLKSFLSQSSLRHTDDSASPSPPADIMVLASSVISPHPPYPQETPRHHAHVASSPPSAASSASPEVVLSQPAASPLSWDCTVCTFSNYGLLSECEMCGEKRGKKRRRRVTGHGADSST